MDADTDHGCHERIMLLCMYEHAVQAVIIKDAVVDTFRGGALFIDFLISIGTTGESRVKPDIPFRPGLDDPSVFGIRAAVFTFGTVRFPIGAAPHEITGGFVILGYKSIVFDKFYDIFLWSMEEEIKRQTKKERKYGL